MKLKNLLAFFLSLALIASITPSIVFADEAEGESEETNVTETTIGETTTQTEKETKSSESEREEETEPSEENESTEPSEPAKKTAPETSKETESVQETVPSDNEPAESGSEEPDETVPSEPGTKENEVSRKRSDAVHNGLLTEKVSYSFNDQDGTLTISGEGGTYSYQKGYSPFESYKNKIKKVIINDGVTFIGSYMFYGFKNITGVSIADSVTGFDRSAFEGCTGITELRLPSKLEDVYWDVFKGCTGIKSITIPGNGESRLLPGSFSSCTGLTTVTIKEGVTEIDGAFKDCTNIKTVNIPKSIKSMNDAFAGCSSITKINYAGTKEEWKKINNGKVTDNFPGATIQFNKSMHTITVLPVEHGKITLSEYEGYSGDEIKITAVPDQGYYYFGYRYNGSNAVYLDMTFHMSDKDIVLEFVFKEISQHQTGSKFDVFPFKYEVTNNATNGTGTVKCLGFVNFASPDETLYLQMFGTSGIPSAVTENGVVYKVTCIAPNAFRDVKYITNFTIGSNVTAIGNNAFYGCSNLTKVSGGSKVKTIGSNAFARCPKLSSFTITSKYLTKIGTYAFNKDSKLKTLYIKYTTKLTKKGVKKSLKGSKVKTVKVKKSKVKKYKKYFTKKNCGRKVKVKK